MSRSERAVLYARCSSQKQADRDLSVPAQLDCCRQYALRQGWLVVGEYHDDGISGFEDERRPEFRRMFEDMARQPRPFDVIVVWDISRFSRSLEHSLRAADELRAAGVRLESTREHLDDTPSGWLMGTILRGFNEFQVRKLAEDTRRGMRKNALEGGMNGGRIPVGYVAERSEGKKSPRRMVTDPEWAPLVQRIFRMALSGQGACNIAIALNEEGLRTYRGRRWSKQSVLYILRNDVYTGVYTWGARPSTKFGATPPEPVRVEDAHPALVSQEDFARVQAVIELRSPAVTHPKTSAGEYLLTGLLVCGECGAKYIGHGARNNTYHYYTCQTKMKQGASACPGASNFERGKVEAVVLEVLQKRALHPSVFGELIREVQQALRASQREAEGQRQVLQGQLAEVERRLTNLYEAVESGAIPAARLAPRLEQVCQEKEALESRLAELPLPGVEPLLEIGEGEIGDWLQDLQALAERGTTDERRGLLRAWIKRVVAHGDELTVEYTFPLVQVDGPSGSSGAGRPPLRVAVRRRSGQPPKNKQGETAVTRFLPTVRNGSPCWTGLELR